MRGFADKRFLPALAALLAAALLTLLAGLGALDRPDRAAADLLYQRPRSAEGRIVLVGIDQRALEELGPYSQWDREIFAQALEALNASEEDRPAVIGLDVLFTGESTPEADAALAEAAGRYGNVVAASAAQFGSITPSGGAVGYTLDSLAPRSYDEP